MLFGVAATWPELARWVISFDGLGPPASGFGDFSLAAMAEQAFGDIAKRAGRGRRVFPDFATLAAQRGDINTRMPDPWVEHLARHGSRPEGDGFVWKWDPLFNTFLPDGFSFRSHPCGGDAAAAVPDRQRHDARAAAVVCVA